MGYFGQGPAAATSHRFPVFGSRSVERIEDPAGNREERSTSAGAAASEVDADWVSEIEPAESGRSGGRAAAGDYVHEIVYDWDYWTLATGIGLEARGMFRLDKDLRARAALDKLQAFNCI